MSVFFLCQENSHFTLTSAPSTFCHENQDKKRRIQNGCFSSREEPKLHGHEQCPSQGQRNISQGQGAAVRHSVPAGGLELHIGTTRRADWLPSARKAWTASAQPCASWKAPGISSAIACATRADASRIRSISSMRARTRRRKRIHRIRLRHVRKIRIWFPRIQQRRERMRRIRKSLHN